MGKLDGKVALISGGTSGIGAAAAGLFLAEGARVVVTGSSEMSAHAARAAMPGVEALASDATDLSAIQTLVADVAARHGRIDVLVVSAGTAAFAPLADVDEAFFDAQFDLNVKGAFFLARAAAPVMADGGAMVLVGSVAAHSGGYGGASVYAATKAAVRSLARTLAQELLPRGIRVNAVSPGSIDTPLIDKNGYVGAKREAFLADAARRAPMGRVGTPAEVAAAILYLAADATYTTGSELFVDGGMADL
ncbi:MAG TPA: SDR family oxidoreductase [Caulobacteraceae bacterium]